MTKSLVKTPEVQALLNKLSGQDQPGGEATRDELIPPVSHVEKSDLGAKYGVNGPHVEIEFDFVLQPTKSEQERSASSRPRAAA